MATSSQVPSYIQDLIRQRAEQYGVDPTLLSRIARVESSYNPRAGASTSSAKGLFQFTNPTWSRYGRGNVYDPDANADAGARFTKANIEGLKASGQNATPGNVYLAHFLGLGGARTVLGADPNTPLSSIPSMRAPIAANPFLKGMRAADVQQWAARKMGGLFDPAEPAPSGRSTAPAQLASNQTALTATSQGLDPADRAALAPWYTKPAVPPAVMASTMASAAPAPTPSGIDQTSVDRVNVLNPADRAAVNAMYPPGEAAPPLPAPAVVASAAPAPITSAAAPSGSIPGTVAPAPAGSQVAAGTAPVLPEPTEVASAAPTSAEPQGQGGLLDLANLTADQGANLTSFSSKLPGLLNAQNSDLPAPPENVILPPTQGPMASQLGAFAKGLKQQKIQQALAQIKSTGYPQQQRGTA